LLERLGLMDTPKKIGVVADLHCGSIFGLLPPGLTTSDDREVKPNIGQRYLWKCWEDAAECIGKLDALVVNGDETDGRQEAQRGNELCLPMLEDQAEAAVQCLRYLLDKTGNPKLYMTAGTEYHSQKAARETEVVAQRLGAEQYKGLGSGRYCKEVLDLNVDGIILNFQHGIGVASGLYRATPPDREGIWSALAGKTGKSPKADCVVRSHAHSYVMVDHPSKSIVVTPCWQLQTRWMRKSSAYRMLPDIGYVLITVDASKKERGYDPCQIDKKIYPLPEPNVTKLNVL